MIRHYNRQHLWGDSTSAPCKICGTFECDGDHHGDHCDQAGTGDQMEVAVAHQRPVSCLDLVCQETFADSKVMLQHYRTCHVL